MKKELKRYYLTSYYKSRETIVQTKMEYEEILKNTIKYNNRKSSKFLFGNITCKKEKDGLHVTAHVYRKLTQRDTLSNIMQIVYNNDLNSLKEIYKEKLHLEDGYIPDINITYLESKNTKGNRKAKSNETYYERGIKYLPMLFIQDRKYLSVAFLKKCMRFHAESNDFNFFKSFAYELSIYDSVSELCSELFEEVDKVEHQNHSADYMLSLGKKLLDQYILERDRDKVAIRLDNGAYQTSMRRLLDVAAFVKYYNSENIKVNNPLHDNKKPTDSKKKELELIKEKERELQLIKNGKIHYEQTSLF